MRKAEALIFIGLGIVGVLATVGAVGWAQAPPSGSEKPITLTITQQELVLLGRALGGLPYAEVAPLMMKLQGQVQGQVSVSATGGAPANDPPK